VQTSSQPFIITTSIIISHILWTGTHHLASLGGAELGDGTKQEIDLIEEINGYQKTQ
jgi:hypothetical protein